MPRNYKRKAGSRRYADYSKEDLNLCMQAVKDGVMSQRKAAEHYQIPRRTLYNKLNDKHTNRPGLPTIFTDEEEQEFVNYIAQTSDFGFPVDSQDLRHIVYIYLSKIGRVVKQFKGNFPGTEWVRSFLKRHTELSVRFAANIKRSRAAVDEKTLTEYIENLKTVTEGVPPQNIWNYDESNLTDDPGKKKVLVKRGTKYPEKIRNSSKSSISLMFAGSATGELLSPFVVYRSAHLWDQWTIGGPLGTRYSNTQSGWFDSITFTDWFKTMMFPKLSKLEGKKVLIGDNLSSHITTDVLKLCRENDIYFVCLPPNSTHLTQPLDVSFFHPVKVAWRKVLADYKDSALGRNQTALQKQHFPLLLKKLMEAVSKNAANNLISGFRKCGIYPTDVQPLLQTLPERKVKKDQIQASFTEFLSDKHTEFAGSGKNNNRKKHKVSSGKSLAHEMSISSDENIVDCPDNIPSTSFDSRTTSSKMKRKQQSQQSSSEDEDNLSFRESEDSMGPFSEDDEFWNLKQSEPELPSIASSFLPVVKEAGKHVIFVYEGEIFPGKIVSFTDSTVTLSSMQKSGVSSWKWPKKPDIMQYPWCDVQGCISEPKVLSKRGFYRVPELELHWS